MLNLRFKPPIVVAHAGAGTWRYVEDISKVVRVLEEAVTSGYEAMRYGSAIEAAVECVRILEDSGILNAGVGSVVDILGRVSMDAGVMEGSSGRVGAVAAVSYPKNPILLAKYVMLETDHVLLAGSGADELAKALGMEEHPGPSESIMRRYRELLSKASKGEPLRWFRRSYELASRLFGLGSSDTVGSIALDLEGRLVAAVSTGGIIMKLPGRVGDSAIVGTGFYADSNVASVATGLGEVIIKSFLTLRISDYYKLLNNLDQAVSKALNELTNKYGRGTAGVIALDRFGYVVGQYNTRAMPWSVISYDLSRAKVMGLPK